MAFMIVLYLLQVWYSQIQMQIESEWQKIIECGQGQSTYLLRAIATPDQLQLQLQDKYSGQIWQSSYSNTAIEQLTQKARNRKKYTVFLNMLRTALQKIKDNLFIEILSYRQIAIKTMKNGKGSNSITPEQAAKRFLILNYNIQFEKIQFPIAIKYIPEPSPQRLKFTIRRLAQELKNLREERCQSQLEKENAYLKYELEAMKSKSKPNKFEGNSSAVIQGKIDELQKEINQKENTINKLNGIIAQLEEQKLAAEEVVRQKEVQIQKKEDRFQELLLEIGQGQSKGKQLGRQQLQYEQKLQGLIRKMEKLGQEVIHSYEKEKKSSIKIATLERQLQSMQKNQSKTSTRFKEDRLSPSSQRSEQKELSVRSGVSGKSGSKKSFSNLNKSKPNLRKTSNKKPSVYDSDTQSSRLRRLNNGRSSPYRQPAPASKRNTKLPNERSRSKSREKVTSPKPKIVESQMYSEAFHSDDSEERFQRLQRQIGKAKPKAEPSRKTTSRVSSTSQNQSSLLENKLQTLEDMIRKAAQSTKKK